MKPGDDDPQDSPADQEDDPFACFDEWAGEADRLNYESFSSVPTTPKPSGPTRSGGR